MRISSPSTIRLPHASEGPFWSPLPTEPAGEWHEIEALLTTKPGFDGTSGRSSRRGIRSFALVAAALVLGGGVLAVTLMGSSPDCGAACHVVTADSAPAGRTAVATAGLAPRSDARMAEGRSVAEPTPNADAAPESMAPPVPRRHRHHRHHPVEP